MARPARRPQPERRAEIAAAALRLIGRGGVDAVTAATLAREVGLTSGALFRHFRTLDEILEAGVDLAARRLEGATPPEDGTPVAWLLALARARVALLEAEPGIAWLLRSEHAPAALPARAVVALRRTVRASRVRIHAAVRRAVAAGELRRDVPAAVLVTVFAATVHALVGPRGLAHRAGTRPVPSHVLRGLFVLLGASNPEVPR